MQPFDSTKRRSTSSYAACSGWHFVAVFSVVLVAPIVEICLRRSDLWNFDHSATSFEWQQQGLGQQPTRNRTIDSLYSSSMILQEETDQKSFVSSFLVYYTHAGYSNQYKGLQRSAQLAWSMDRTLVVAPILPHNNKEAQRYRQWKRAGAGAGCSAYREYQLYQAKALDQALNAASVAKQSKKDSTYDFPSFRYVIDLDELQSKTGLKTLDLDEFMMQQYSTNPKRRKPDNDTNPSLFSYNTSVHTWCDANIQRNFSYDSDGQCTMAPSATYELLLLDIRGQIRIQDGQSERREEGLYYKDCQVLNVGSAFLIRNGFSTLHAKQKFDSFFDNPSLQEPWKEMLRILLRHMGGGPDRNENQIFFDYVGVHVRTKDNINECEDPQNMELYNKAAQQVLEHLRKLALGKGITNTLPMLQQHNPRTVFVGRVNSLSKQCLQEAITRNQHPYGDIENSAINATNKTILELFSNIAVMTMQDILTSLPSDLKQDMDRLKNSIALEDSTKALLLDQLLLSMAEPLILQSAYSVSTFQELIKRRYAYRQQNLQDLGFLVVQNEEDHNFIQVPNNGNTK